MIHDSRPVRPAASGAPGGLPSTSDEDDRNRDERSASIRRRQRVWFHTGRRRVHLLRAISLGFHWTRRARRRLGRVRLERTDGELEYEVSACRLGGVPNDGREQDRHALVHRGHEFREQRRIERGSDGAGLRRGRLLQQRLRTSVRSPAVEPRNPNRRHSYARSPPPSKAKFPATSLDQRQPKSGRPGKSRKSFAQLSSVTSDDPSQLLGQLQSISDDVTTVGNEP